MFVYVSIRSFATHLPSMLCVDVLTGRRRIAKSAVKANLDLCPRLGTPTIYRSAVMRDSKVDRAIKAEIREGSGHYVPGYIAPQHGWPETSRQPLRGNFEKAPRV